MPLYPRFRRVGACLLALQMLLPAGCAPVRHPAEPAASQLPGANSAIDAATYRVQRAWRLQDKLYIDALVDGRDTMLEAQLPGSRDPYQRSRSTAQLHASTVSPPVTTDIIRVLDAQHWRELLLAMQDSVAQSGGRHGVVIDVLSEHELFVYRDEDDVLRSVPIEYKPTDRRIERSYPLDRLLADYAAGQREKLGIPANGDGLVLYETGDAQQPGYPFVLIDLARTRVVFLQAAADVASTDASGAGPLIAETGVHTVTGHVRSAVEQPVSSVARLLALTTTALTDLVHPGVLRDRRAPVPPLANGAAMDLQAWEGELDRITGRNVSTGRLRLLVDGNEYFPALVTAIEDARRSVDVRVYIFDNDDYALQVADLLKRRAREIGVRVLVDGLGTLGGASAPPDYLPPGYVAPGSIVQYLTRDSAVRVKVAANPWMTGDHTKSIIVDDAVAFVGGMNIGREYRYEWHDLMVEARGAVVDDLRRDFEHAWDEQRPLGEVWSLLRDMRRSQAPARPGDYPLRILQTLPGDSQILRAQLTAIRRARQRIYIQNAYFTSDAILYELDAARRRGVDVRVILPYRNDSGVLQRSNAIAANFMLARGIRVYIYPGMSHVKGAVYDGWACFGSANFDSLSLRVNRELNLATSHPELVEEIVHRVFEADMRVSVELTRPFPEKWSDFLTELLSDRL